MGSHRAGPPTDDSLSSSASPHPASSAAPEPAPVVVAKPSPPAGSKEARRLERLVKTEQAAAEYARRDAERAERRAARQRAEDQRRGRVPAEPVAAAPAATSATSAPSADGWFSDTGDNPVVAQQPDRQKGKAAAKVREPKPPKAPRERRPPDPRRGRRRAFVAVFTALGLAAVVGGGLAVANFAESAGGEDTALPPAEAMSAAALAQLTGVPAKSLDKVGAGSAVNLLGRVDAPALRVGKKPRLLYIGAESCPNCAAERWALVVALSRFGTWTGLGVIRSPKEEVFPNTPTLSFHGATYKSKYLAFSGFETQSRLRVNGQYAPLDALSAADAATLRDVRTDPYVPAEATSRLPFIDLAGEFVGAGTHIRAAFMPFFADKTHDQIAAALADPTTALAKSIDGGANAYTAAICEVIPKKTRPKAVCGSEAVRLGKSILRAKR